MACGWRDEIFSCCVVRGNFINVHGFEEVNSTDVKVFPVKCVASQCHCAFLCGMLKLGTVFSWGAGVTMGGGSPATDSLVVNTDGMGSPAAESLAINTDSQVFTLALPNLTPCMTR